MDDRDATPNERRSAVAVGMIMVPSAAFCVYIAASGDRVKSGSIEEKFLLSMACLILAGIVTVPVGLYLLIWGQKPPKAVTQHRSWPA